MHKHLPVPGRQEKPRPVSLSLGAILETARIPNEPADQVQVDEFLQPVNEPVIVQLALRRKDIRDTRLLEVPPQTIRSGGDALKMEDRAPTFRTRRQGSRREIRCPEIHLTDGQVLDWLALRCRDPIVHRGNTPHVHPMV